MALNRIATAVISGIGALASVFSPMAAQAEEPAEPPVAPITVASKEGEMSTASPRSESVSTADHTDRFSQKKQINVTMPTKVI